jgi:hypothetical protein
MGSPDGYDLQRPDRSNYGAFAGLAVAHHQAMALFVALVLMLFDVIGDFLFDRLDEKPAGSFPQHLIERRARLDGNGWGRRPRVWIDLTALRGRVTLMHGVSSLFLFQEPVFA